MSRIGKMPVSITSKIEVNIIDNLINVKWPLWELSFKYSPLVSVFKEKEFIVVKPLKNESKALWWTTRAIINNMVMWVTEGYKKSLEINGVWYQFQVISSKLILSIGYSHKVDIEIPTWLKVALDEKAKNVIHIIWINKQLVWEFASKIRAKKKPEPYKWKWIKYVWEYVRRKAWKKGTK